jgi:hypothetical protein
MIRIQFLYSIFEQQRMNGIDGDGSRITSHWSAHGLLSVNSVRADTETLGTKVLSVARSAVELGILLCERV